MLCVGWFVAGRRFGTGDRKWRRNEEQDKQPSHGISLRKTIFPSHSDQSWFPLQKHLRKIDRRARADVLEIRIQPRRCAVAAGVAQAAQQAPFGVKLRRSAE